MNEGKVLLDMKGLVMHSYHRCKDRDSTLFNESGERVTRATVAFETLLASYLVDVFQAHAPINVIAVWDAGNTKRRQLFADYKRKRSERAKEPVEDAQLAKMYKFTKDFLAGMGCVQVSVPDTEADDVIAYLARSITPYCIIHTVDHDLLQLTSETCAVMVKGEPKEEYKNTPYHLLALQKSIVGDSSDEYPGVPRLGAVAWQNMVDAFGIDGMEELDQIARDKNVSLLKAVAADVNSKELTRIADGPYQWLLMYELAILHPEWCEGTFNKKLVKPSWFKRLPNRERVMKVLAETHCIDMLHHFEHYLPVTVLITAENMQEMLYEGNFLDDLNENLVALDYETYDVNQYESLQQASRQNYVDVLSQRLTGASFTWGANLNKTVYISVGHKDTPNAPKSVISDFLMAADKKVVHNSQFETAVTATEFGEEFVTEHLYAPIDTTVLCSYADENNSRHLKDNSLIWLNYHQTTYKDLMTEHGVNGMNELTGEQVLDYGADDAFVTAHLWSLLDLITMVEGTRSFMYENEFLTNKVFDASFRKGCHIDEAARARMEKEDQARLDELWPQLRQLLADNCKEINEEAAAKYHEEIKEFIVASMAHSGKTDKEIHDKLSAMQEEFRQKTVYTPYVREVIPYEFKPTKAQIRDVLLALGIPAVFTMHEGTDREQVMNEEFYPASAAVSRIAEWVVGMHAIREQEDTFTSGVAAKYVTDEVLKFADLVSAAAHQFKKGEGEEYRAMCAYVEAMFADKAKVKETGDELNLDSPKQMAEILYGKLGLPIRHYTKVTDGSTRDELNFAGGPSSGDKAVEIALAEDCQDENSWQRAVLETVREIKTIQTKFKFYYRPYPLWVHPLTGKIHPSVSNCGTTTRRPTGGSPNILQVAKGPIRSMYKTMEDKGEEEHILIAPDFAGQELRLLASESGDPVLLDAFLGEHPKDIHSLTSTALMPNLAKKMMPDLVSQILRAGKVMDYDQFEAWRKDEAYAEFANFVRNKRAKACIAEGSLVLTDRGLVPIEKVELLDLVWDGIEWVTHEGLIYKGMRKVVSYEGLAATPDHEVYTDDGNKLPLQKIIDASEQKRPCIAVTEIAGAAIRYSGDLLAGELGGASTVSLQGAGHLPSLRGSEDCACGKSATQANCRMPMPAKEIYGPEAETSGSALSSDSSAMRKPEVKVLQELRCQRHKESVQESGGLHCVGAGEVASPDIQGRAAGQEGQRRTLQQAQYAAGLCSGESLQQAHDQVGDLPRGEGSAATSVASDQAGPSRVPLRPHRRCEATESRLSAGQDTRVPSEDSRRQKVYDIVNAGPRHRFTVSGKLAHNCNFLVNYGGGASTLSTNIMVPREEAQEFIDGMFELYPGIPRFQEDAHKLARTHGFVSTAYGNRRHMTDDILSRDDGKRMRMERQAANAIIQGCAADILKVVVAECERSGLLRETKSYVMAPVYDELVCSVPLSQAVYFCQRLQKIMDVTPPGHKVPMVSEFKLGFDWYNLVEIGTDTSADTVMAAITEARKKHAGVEEVAA